MTPRSLAALLLSLSLLAGAADAQTASKATVDAAKAQGAVGEQADGFLGLVNGAAPPAVKAAVADINAGRAQAYRDIAAKSGVTEVAAGEAAARQLFSRIPSGDYYKPLNGCWTRK